MDIKYHSLCHPLSCPSRRFGFVHEFGHFIVARSLGVSVSAFSIGFGKELWSRTDKKGTVWKISAIPLGGYCQFLGDADESSSTSDVDLSKYTEEEQKHLFATQTPYKKLAIAIAGPLFNYLFAFITFLVCFILSEAMTFHRLYPKLSKKALRKKPVL